MTIDVHAHLYGPGLAAPFWIESMVRYGSGIVGRPEQYVRERIESEWFDPAGDLLVRDMDEAGIDRTVVFALDFGLLSDVDDDVSLSRRYDLFAAAVANHPDRLVLFGGIDPRRPTAARFVERAVGEWGIRGLKLWTPAGFRPNEASCYRVYEKAAELDLPVVVHTGQEIGPLNSECTSPIFVDQPANDFPEVTFVLAHAGMAWSREAAEIAWHHQNVFVDIAAWQQIYLRDEGQFFADLRQLISLSGKEKVLFGTDWPAFRKVDRVAPKTWVSILRGAPDRDGGAVRFDADEMEWLLGKAAEQALGI